MHVVEALHRQQVTNYTNLYKFRHWARRAAPVRSELRPARTPRATTWVDIHTVYM